MVTYYIFCKEIWHHMITRAGNMSNGYHPAYELKINHMFSVITLHVYKMIRHLYVATMNVC